MLISKDEFSRRHNIRAVDVLVYIKRNLIACKGRMIDMSNKKNIVFLDIRNAIPNSHNTKKCYKCNKEKDLSLFYKKTETKVYIRRDPRSGVVTMCKTCYSEKQKQSRKRNAAAFKIATKKRYDRKRALMILNGKKCPDCNTIKDVSFFKTETKSLSSRCVQCREIAKENYRIKKNKERADRRKAYPEKHLAYNKSYRSLPEKKVIRNARLADRKKIDKVFVFKSRVRRSLAYSLNKKGFSKKFDLETILGCSIDVLISHFESKFTNGMSWENIGEWHIDHKIPLYIAKTEEEVIKLNHYTNLQPLWAIDNLKKGKNLIHAPL